MSAASVLALTKGAEGIAVNLSWKQLEQKLPMNQFLLAEKEQLFLALKNI